MSKRIIDVYVGEPTVTRGVYGEEYIYIADRKSIDFEVSIDTIINRLEGYKMLYADKYTDLHFQGDRDCGCRYDCHCSPTYYLRGKRLETDLEEKYRNKKERALEADREKREREELERLMQKYNKG